MGPVELYAEIPVHTMQDLHDYKVHGKPPGGFLRLVLENAAVLAVVSHADDAHARALKPIVKWIYNNLQTLSWGTPEKVDEWIAQGGEEPRPRLNVIQGGAS